MASELTERLSGMGKVFSGQDFVANVRYEVRVYQDYQVGRPLDGGVRGKVPTSLRIHLNMTTAPVSRKGQVLTLHLRGGRKIDFLVHSYDGQCKAMGHIQD